MESITAKHWQWQAKLFRYGMLCFAAASFGPTNALSTYGRSGVHEGETGKEEEEQEEGKEEGSERERRRRRRRRRIRRGWERGKGTGT